MKCQIKFVRKFITYFFKLLPKITYANEILICLQLLVIRIQMRSPSIGVWSKKLSTNCAKNTSWSYGSGSKQVFLEQKKIIDPRPKIWILNKKSRLSFGSGSKQICQDTDSDQKEQNFFFIRLDPGLFLGVWWATLKPRAFTSKTSTFFRYIFFSFYL